MAAIKHAEQISSLTIEEQFILDSFKYLFNQPFEANKNGARSMLDRLTDALRSLPQFLIIKTYNNEVGNIDYGTFKSTLKTLLDMLIDNGKVDRQLLVNALSTTEQSKTGLWISSIDLGSLEKTSLERAEVAYGKVINKFIDEAFASYEEGLQALNAPAKQVEG